MHVLVVRHTQVHYGSETFDPDPPLTALGRRQAAALADRLYGVGLTTSTVALPVAACRRPLTPVAVPSYRPPSWGGVWRYVIPRLQQGRLHCPAAAAVEVSTEAEWGVALDEGAPEKEVAAAALAARGQAVAQTLFARQPRGGTDRICVVTPIAPRTSMPMARRGSCSASPGGRAGTGDGGRGGDVQHVREKSQPFPLMGDLVSLFVSIRFGRTCGAVMYCAVLGDRPLLSADLVSATG